MGKTLKINYLELIESSGCAIKGLTVNDDQPGFALDLGWGQARALSQAVFAPLAGQQPVVSGCHLQG